MKGRRPKPTSSGIPVLDLAGPWFSSVAWQNQPIPIEQSVLGSNWH